ncbi:MAG TPA: type II toxin-antitoxin system prevent-host-death family antitoxin [Anaerolineales bacterium]|nr:type II toxin-antitoxin system prevent-host-death family antitoxin [Anaerolineales bacterium]
MTIQTTYTQARASLARLLDAVVDDREIVIIQRKSGKRAALIDADELMSLLETAYLLSSPKNAERLLAALARSLKGEGRRMTLDELRKEAGLDQEKP